jgi:hypothetical protein
MSPLSLRRLPVCRPRGAEEKEAVASADFRVQGGHLVPGDRSWASLRELERPLREKLYKLCRGTPGAGCTPEWRPRNVCMIRCKTCKSRDEMFL